MLPNGTACSASVELVGAESFRFTEPGVLGERIPVSVTGINVSREGSPVPYESAGQSEIRFPTGNYTISYEMPIRGSHLAVLYDQPYQVEVLLPADLDVRNLLLGMVSQGGTVNASPDGSKTVTWNETYSAELRFYDANQESLLYLFGNIWLMAAVVLLLPFALTWRRRK